MRIELVLWLLLGISCHNVFFCKNLKFMELNWMSNSTRYPLYKKRFFFRPQIQNLCAIWLCGRIHSFSWRVQKKRHENVFSLRASKSDRKKANLLLADKFYNIVVHSCGRSLIEIKMKKTRGFFNSENRWKFHQPLSEIDDGGVVKWIGGFYRVIAHRFEKFISP